MPRVPASVSYQRRLEVHTLRNDKGLSLREICTRTGLQLRSVQNYLAAPLPALNPQLVLDEAVSLKLDRPDYGPAQVLDNLALQLGFDRNNPPVSESTLTDLFGPKKLNIARRQINHRGDKKPPYWLCDYDRPGKAVQMDTVKVVLDSGEQVEILTVFDVVSRALWAEVLPKDGSHVWCLKRAFDALGVPQIITTDNGAGFNLETRYRLSPVVRYAFQRGVRQFHFIPVASPWHNGLVERLHRTMKRGDWLHSGRDACRSLDDVAVWLNRFLHYYNTIKSHGALGGKRQRTTPAMLHRSYTHLEVAAHQFGFTASDAPVSGVVSYTRRINSRGFARVDAPVMLFDIRSSSAFGRLARFSLNVADGSGEVHIFPDDNPAQMQLVGTFRHELGADCKTDGYLPVQLLPGVQFVPLPFDEQAELERERKHLKKGRRLPLPAGYRFVDLPEGEWQVVNRHGLVVTTSQHRIVDHLAEVLGDGWGQE